jgi:hypothetical protein
VSWLIDWFRGFMGLILPFLGRAGRSAGLGRGLRWFFHILIITLVLVGLYFLNNSQTLRIYENIPGHPWLRRTWLPLLFLLSYILCWLGYWLWTLLIVEDEHPEFPDINEAWDEALAALEHKGFDLRNMPVFLVVGRAESPPDVLLQAARLGLELKQAPDGDAPLHVYASKDAIFITCEGCCLLGQQTSFLTGNVAPAQTLGADEEEIMKTLAPVNAGGAVPEFLAIRQRAERERRELTPDEQRRIRALIRKEQMNAAPIRNPDELARHTARFEHFCRLLSRDRWPYVPLNGVLVLVPFAATDSDQDALDTGATCQYDLDVIQRVLQVQSPTLALVCDLETAPGFRSFIERFPDKQRHQRVGHRCPFIPDLEKLTVEGDPVKARALMFEGLANWICGAVVAGWVSKHYRLETPGRDSVGSATTDNAQLFLFMNELRHRGRRLGRLLSRGMAPETAGPVWFGGCYLAGTGRNAESQQGFVAGVFRRLIEEEKKGLVSWTPQALHEEAGLQRWVGTLQIALGAVVVAALAMIGFAWWNTKSR